MGFAILVSLVAGLAALIVMALIAAVRSQLRLRGSFGSAPGEDGPWREEALVRVGPPRNPLSEAAVALPLPDPEPSDTVEAYGREVREGEASSESLAS
jgi:hypothetical protein